MGSEFFFQPRKGTVTEHVLQQTAEPNVSEFQFSSFSNRQDLHADWQNSCKRDHHLGYSSFQVFDAFESYLVQQSSARCRIGLDRFLLQDAAAGCEAGASWAAALAHYDAYPELLDMFREKPPVPPGAKPGWGKHEGTERKVDLVYIKAHRLANRYPGKKIHVHVYDDREDIIEENRAFYSAQPDLLPRGLTLCLHLYSSEARRRVALHTVEGSGHRNTRAEQLNCKLMAHFARVTPDDQAWKYFKTGTIGQMETGYDFHKVMQKIHRADMVEVAKHKERCDTQTRATTESDRRDQTYAQHISPYRDVPGEAIASMSLGFPPEFFP